MHDVGDAKAAGFGQAFKTGGHVDAVAQDIVLLDHDVADIDADAVLDARFRRLVLLVAAHGLLHLSGAEDGVR